MRQGLKSNGVFQGVGPPYLVAILTDTARVLHVKVDSAEDLAALHVLKDEPDNRMLECVSTFSVAYSATPHLAECIRIPPESKEIRLLGPLRRETAAQSFETHTSLANSEWHGRCVCERAVANFHRVYVANKCDSLQQDGDTVHQRCAGVAPSLNRRPGKSFF